MEIFNSKVVVLLAFILAVQLGNPSSVKANLLKEHVDADRIEIKEQRHFVNVLDMRVQGIVTDDAGEPLVGVSVYIKGTKQGTVTDINGNFSIENVDENATLVVSYIGFESQEVAVAGKSSLTIVLLTNSQALEDVVVVGYGVQKKESVVGAISQ